MKLRLPTTSSLRSWLSGCLRFLHSCQRRLSWPRYLRASCVVVGVMYATAMTYGEVQYVKARKLAGQGDAISALFLYERAQAFPLAYRIREASMSLLGTLDGVPPEIALQRIDALLKDDPWGPRPNFFKVLHESRRGRPDLAKPALDRLDRSLPGAEQTILAHQIYQAGLDQVRRRLRSAP